MSEKNSERIKLITSDINWPEDKKEVIAHLPKKKIEELYIIWLRAEGLSYDQIAIKARVGRARVAYVLSGAKRYEK